MYHINSVILILICWEISLSKLVINSEFFPKDVNYDFLYDQRVILKFISTTRLKCFSECLVDSTCYFVIYMSDKCQLYKKFAILTRYTTKNTFIYSKLSNFYNEGVNLNDFFTKLPYSTTFPIIISSANNKLGINWGDWGAFEECDENNCVVGFRTKLHSPQGFGLNTGDDDTALNGVQLICSNGKKLISSVGKWGDWDTNFKYCKNNQKIIGFSYGMQINKGSGDDTATNVIRLICSDGLAIVSLEAPWSDSIISITCLYGVIVGIRTQVEAPNTNDNTALNNIEFICKLNS
ncbi:unnamed protein product [Brachionus calyciflorus]|uniref:Vitelline membrane outer layer 1-like protein n=1 Tax=Brachionus calyciflorus TaxID=104777 RepID=A0A814EKT1_9BILA|nr:unnamed protein product [Brachionus calyciflorus]